MTERGEAFLAVMLAIALAMVAFAGYHVGKQDIQACLAEKPHQTAAQYKLSVEECGGVRE